MCRTAAAVTDMVCISLTIYCHMNQKLVTALMGLVFTCISSLNSSSHDHMSTSNAADMVMGIY